MEIPSPTIFWANTGSGTRSIGIKGPESGAIKIILVVELGSREGEVFIIVVLDLRIQTEMSGSGFADAGLPRFFKKTFIKIVNDLRD